MVECGIAPYHQFHPYDTTIPPQPLPCNGGPIVTI